MLTNLLRPWLLARLLSGAAVAVLAAVALLAAWQVLRYWRLGASSEGQLALERRAELVATIVQVALVGAVLHLAMTVYAADRLTHSIRGAMCAWGVFDASAYGFRALGVTALAALGCALWVIFHRLDLALAKPTLTRRKFASLFLLAPLLWLDLGVTAAFFLDLDMSVVATCCSAGLDDVVAQSAGATGLGRGSVAILAFAAALGAGGAAALAGLRPGPASAWLAAGATVVAAALAVPAIIGTVAPYAFETPVHLCPFCLFHLDEAGGLGWPLFAALFSAAATGLGIGLVEAQRRASGEPKAVDAIERRLGLACAAAWVLTALLGVAPVVRYVWLSGGAPLFGS